MGMVEIIVSGLAMGSTHVIANLSISLSDAKFYRDKLDKMIAEASK